MKRIFHIIFLLLIPALSFADDEAINSRTANDVVAVGDFIPVYDVSEGSGMRKTAGAVLNLLVSDIAGFTVAAGNLPSSGSWDASAMTLTLPSSVALDTELHSQVTIGTANGLSLSGQEISLGAATSLAAGAMTAAQVQALEAVDSESELESMLDLPDLQGAITTSQIFTAGTLDWSGMTLTLPATFALTTTKLDDFSAADDNTDLNATTSAHGLCPKLGGGTTNFFRADGTWAEPPGGGGFTDLTDFDEQTPWRLFCSNADGDVTELGPFGDAGTVLKSNGATSAPSWQTDATGAGGDQLVDVVTTSPLTINGGANVNDILPGSDADITFAINDAAADGSTKGAAAFNANHFDSSSGVISLDTSNGPFVLTTAIDTLGELEAVANGGAYMSDLLAATSESNFKSIVNLEAGIDYVSLTPLTSAPTLVNGWIYVADNSSYDPASVTSTSNPYSFLYYNSNYIPLRDMYTGDLLLSAGAISEDVFDWTTFDYLGDEGLPTLAGLQSAVTSDFHNLGGTDDDVPEAGDFGAATDLDANGAINAGAVGADELASTAVTPGSYTSTSITVDADGRITAASNGSGASAYESGTEADFCGTILNPQGVYDNDSTNHAVTLVVNVPAAFTITAIYVSCDADPTTEPTLTFRHKAAGVGYGTPTTIEAVTTTAGVAAITSGFDDDTIPANTKIFITLSDPDDALTEIAWQIKGDWD